MPHPQLFEFYKRILCNANRRPSDDEEAQIRLKFYHILKDSALLRDSASEWISCLCRDLEVQMLLEMAGNRTGELEDLAEFQRVLTQDMPRRAVQDLGFRHPKGKVVLTTIHSSKGREFEYVILAGTQDTLIPWRDWAGNPTKVQHFRRLFYVACTRASRGLYIVYSTRMHLSEPRKRWTGPSPFVLELKEKLGG